MILVKRYFAGNVSSLYMKVPDERDGSKSYVTKSCMRLGRPKLWHTILESLNLRGSFGRDGVYVRHAHVCVVSLVGYASTPPFTKGVLFVLFLFRFRFIIVGEDFFPAELKWAYFLRPFFDLHHTTQSCIVLASSSQLSFSCFDRLSSLVGGVGSKRNPMALLV